MTIRGQSRKNTLTGKAAEQVTQKSLWLMMCIT